LGQDSRNYSLINRLNKVDSDLAELKRLRQRVSQLEVLNTQQKRRIQDESRRVDQLSQKNRSLVAFVNGICEQEVNLVHKDACRKLQAARETK
jgi:uncharacterized protein YdcH (DUF465 family)